MANSDDGFRRDDGQGPSADESNRPKKTLGGLNLQIPRPPRPPAATPASRATLEDVDSALATAASDAVDEAVASIEDDINAAFGFVPDSAGPVDDDFPEEATQVGQSPLEFPDDQRVFNAPPVPEEPEEPELGGLYSDSLPDPIRAPAAGPGLEEDSLPQPIRPTLDRAPESSRAEWSATIPSNSFGGLPLEGDYDLPTPIRPDTPGPQPAVAEDAGEFPAEKTELLDSPFEQDPAVAKLVTLDGPSVGQEFFASGLRNTIGRGLNNSIVVGDLAMSRQHFEILKNPDESYTLRDLQSINGTTLNGTKVREADLFHGDRIEAGKSTFQFVVTGNVPGAQRARRLVPAATSTLDGTIPQMPIAPAAADAEPVNRLLTLISIAALCVSLVLIMAIAFVILNRMEDKPEVATGPPASELYLDGVEAVKAREWDRAQAQFERAKALDPKLEGIDDQLRRLDIERKAARDLEEGRRLAEKGLLDHAIEAIGAIPRDSVYHAEAADLARDVRKLEIEQTYTAALEAMNAEDVATAREGAEKVLSNVPTHEGAQALLARIEAFEIGGAEAVEDVEAESTGELAAASPSRSDDDDFSFELVGSQKKSKKKRRQSRPSSTSTSGRVPNFTQGFILYRTKKFTQARQFFETASKDEGPAAPLAEKIAGHIRDFQEHYEAGTAAFRARKWDEAEKRLSAAKRSDSHVASGAGHFDGELSKKLAIAHAHLGLEALSAGKGTEAKKHASAARNFDRNEEMTQKLEAALEKEASSMYIQALNVRKSDPAAAAKLCRQIKAIVPSSSDSHQKADKLLKSL